MVPTLFRVVVAAALLVPLGTAAAQTAGETRRLAVLAVTGNVPPRVRQSMEGSLRKGIQDAVAGTRWVQVTPLEINTMLMQLGEDPGACEQGRCTGEIMEMMALRSGVTGELMRVADSYYVTVTLWGPSGPSGQVASETTSLPQALEVARQGVLTLLYEAFKLGKPPPAPVAANAQGSAQGPRAQAPSPAKPAAPIATRPPASKPPAADTHPAPAQPGPQLAAQPAAGKAPKPAAHRPQVDQGYHAMAQGVGESPGDTGEWNVAPTPQELPAAVTPPADDAAPQNGAHADAQTGGHAPTPHTGRVRGRVAVLVTQRLGGQRAYKVVGTQHPVVRSLAQLAQAAGRDIATNVRLPGSVARAVAEDGKLSPAGARRLMGQVPAAVGVVAARLTVTPLPNGMGHSLALHLRVYSEGGRPQPPLQKVTVSKCDPADDGCMRQALGTLLGTALPGMLQGLPQFAPEDARGEAPHQGRKRSRHKGRAR